MTSRNLLSFFGSKLHIKICRNLSKTTTKCPPKPKPMNLTIAGANSDTGRISALLFKQQKIFKTINLYDKDDTAGLAHDLNGINTTPNVVSYYGIKNLEAAVTNARIVYICGGIQIAPGMCERDLFEKNVAWVRQIIMYCSEFNPEVMVVIATPPVSFLVPMAVEEFRLNDINAEKRVFGLVRTIVSRANSLSAQCLNVVPNNINSFVVGGAHRKTCIPILSLTQHTSNLKAVKNEALTKSIQDAEEIVLRKKMEVRDSKGCFLSTAYNGIKFTTSLAAALEGVPGVADCAYVKQDEPMEKYAKYFSCLVHLNKNGIESCNIPKMSDVEKNRLKLVINEIHSNIYLGSSYVTGDDIIIVRKPHKEEKKPESTKIKRKVKEKKKKVCEKTKPPKTLRIKIKA